MSDEIRNDFTGDDFKADNYVEPEVNQETNEETNEVKKVNRTGSETEIREVDPTKNEKLRNRQIAAKNKVKKKAFKLPKWALFGGIALVAIIAIFVVKTVNSAMNSTKNTYFTVFDTVLKPTEPGSFSYEIYVGTKEANADETVNVNETETNNVDKLNEMASVEQTETNEETGEQTEEVKTSNHIFREWTNVDGTKVVSWQYPTFQINIEGICLSAEPYEARFDITLGTPVTNGKFTEVIVKEGKYYIDLDTMRNWLVTSKDSYLMSVAENIPEGIKFVEIPEEEFEMYSRYAEVSERKDSCASLKTKISRGLTFVNMLESSIKAVVPSECYQTTQDSYKINIGSETGHKIISMWSNMVLNANNTYSQYLTTIQNNGLLDETQAKQAVNERDNILKALDDLQIYFNLTDIQACDLQATGTAREYKNAQGNAVAESTLDFVIKTPEKNYTVNCKLMRSGGNGVVEAPTSSVMAKSELKESYENVVYDTLNRVVDYFNPTCIELSEQLEPNPDKVIENIKQSLVDIVNSTESTGVYLTILTVDDYIEKYINMDYDTALEQDRINILIVNDFMDTLNAVTGNVTVSEPNEEETQSEELEIQYPEVVFENSEIKIISNYNEEESNSNLYVVDALIMNKKDTPISIDLTNFSVRTLLSSKYSANSFTELHSYDNTWDDNISPTSVDLAESAYANVKLYFVVNGDSGYMDLWFGEESLGDIIRY